VAFVFGIQRDLRTYTLLADVFGILCGVIGAGLIASLFNLLPGEQILPDPIERLARLGFGAILLVVAYYLIVGLLRWYRHSTWVVKNALPRDGQLTITSAEGDPPTYYATLTASGFAAQRYGILPPRMDTLCDLAERAIPARAYVDPQTGLAVAFDIHSEMLWVMPPGKPDTV